MAAAAPNTPIWSQDDLKKKHVALNEKLRSNIGKYSAASALYDKFRALPVEQEALQAFQRKYMLDRSMKKPDHQPYLFPPQKKQKQKSTTLPSLKTQKEKHQKNNNMANKKKTLHSYQKWDLAQKQLDVEACESDVSLATKHAP